MKIRSLIVVIAAAVLLAGLWPRVALAGAFTYASTRKEIKVGILLVRNPTDMTAAPENPDPYVFYVMDMRTDLKPAGWDFVNPLAPKTVSEAVRARRSDYSIYQVGQPLTKNMAAYWEVPLYDTSLENLLQFDLLFIHNHRPNTGFLPEEREKLRQLVDAGGQIWIEDCGQFSIDRAKPFFMDLNFTTSGASGEAIIPPGARTHPLLTTPYWITDAELSRLGDGKLGGGAYLTNRTGGRLTEMTPVVLNGSANCPYEAVANYGSGMVVASAADIGCAINDGVGRDYVTGVGNNSGPYCGENFQLAQTEDLKFAYNLVATAFSSPTYGKNMRRTGRSKEYLAPPVQKKWDKPIVPTLSTGPINNTDQGQGPAPAIYKNVAFVCGADKTIYALDCDPYSDIDMDGNPDDGELGGDDPLNYWPDVIWRFRVDGATWLSSPTVASVPDGNGGMDDIVYVAACTGSGTRIIALRAFPMVSGRLGQNAQVVATKDISAVDVAGAPAYLSPTRELPPATTGTGSPDSGTVFVMGKNRTDNSGVIHRLNARTLDLLSDANGEGNIVGSGFSTAPSIARVRDTASGATDLIVAGTTKAPTTSGAGHLAIYTYAVSNEQLTPDPAHRDAGNMEFYTRFASGGPEGSFAGVQMRIATLSDGTPWLRLRYKDVNGNDCVWDPTASPAVGSGTIDVNTSAPGKIKIRSLDPEPAADTPIFADYALDTVRRSDSPQADFKRSSMVPMYPGKGIDRPFGCGSVAIGVDGTLYYGATQFSSSGATSGSIYAIQLQRKHPVVRWKYSLTDMAIVGTPVVGDGVVYVAACNGSGSCILAFNTRKNFRYSAGVALKPVISINQPDVFEEAKTNQPAGYTVDYPTGTITITDFGGCDASLPFKVSDANNANVPFYLDGKESDPVQPWNSANSATTDFYSRANVPGIIIDSPVLAGSVLYFLARTPGGTALYSMKANGLELDNPVPCTNNFATGENFALNAAPAGAGGTIVLNGMMGIYGLYSPVTLIADNSRLIEIQDPAQALGTPPAQVVWTCTNTYKLVPVKSTASTDGSETDTPAPVMVSTPLRQPSMARRLNQTNMLVADTGNNRVVEIDRAGREVWEATHFSDPYGLLPPGQPLTLSRPTDAQRWYSYDQGSSGFQMTMHTVIADSGNYRIISLTTPVRGSSAWASTEHVLEWVSDSAIYGKNYSYRSFDLLPAGTNGHRQILCGIDNVALDYTGKELGDGSSIAVLDYLPTNSAANAASARGAILEAYYNAARPDGTNYRFYRVSSAQRFAVPGTGSFAGEHILIADGKNILDAARDTANHKLVLRQPEINAPGTTCARLLSTGEILTVENNEVKRRSPLDGTIGIPATLAGPIRVTTDDALGSGSGTPLRDYPVRPTFADRAF